MNLLERPILVQEIEQVANEIRMRILGRNILINEVNSFTSIKETNANSISYLSSLKHFQSSVSDLSGVILLHQDLATEDFLGRLTCSYIVVDDPRYLFAFTLNQFVFAAGKLPPLSCPVDSEIAIPVSTNVSSDARIGQNVIIGERVNISGGVYIHSNTQIGNDVIIKPNTIIGGDGFGYAVRVGFPPIKIPHTGGVKIGDNVHIGSGTNIDQGTFEPTVISDDVKIDNGVHIAHNVNIGARSLVIAHAEISGSVIIGEDVWIAPNVSIREKLIIGDRALIGIGSVVTKNVAAGETVFGSPARMVNSGR